MIFEKLKQIIVDQLAIGPNEIELDSDIVDDFNADSLDIVEMLMKVESEWDIEVEDEEIEELRTVQDIVNLIESKL